jgi:cupin fold WbuC family metalloprotein
MLLAFPNTTGPVFTLTEDLLTTGFTASAASPRKRIILPLHRTQDALVQRMLNFMQPGTYLIPHLHPLPHASETIQVLRGAIGFFVFDPQGTVLSKHLLRADGLGLIDIEPNVWHGFVVLEPDTVVLEIKRGPYDPVHDKVFATWSPKEGEAGATEAVKKWEELFR